MRVDFIFMLTRADQTVKNCLEVFDSISDTGLGHVGFKDIGVDRATLAELHGRIKATGAVSYPVPDDFPSEDAVSLRSGV